MKASIVDLRYNMHEVLEALDRSEEVHVYYHGREKGVLVPVKSKKSPQSIQDHPFFGMCKKQKGTPLQMVSQMRKGRY